MKLNKHKKYVRLGLIIIVAVAPILLIGITTIIYFNIKDSVSSQDAVMQSPDSTTYIVTGKVTRIDKNGRDWMLNENGEKVPGPGYGFTDGGDSITVGGQSFRTSCGSCNVADSYHVSTGELQLGDQAVVEYAVDQNGMKTMNCQKCRITKL